MEKIMDNGLLKFLSDANKIAIITHKNPDGDAIGSAMMMYEFIDTYFKDKKKEVFTDYVVLDEEISLVCRNININPNDTDFDSAICLDCGDKSLLGKFEYLFESIDNTICIDHHKSNTMYAKVNMVECLPSNCEYLYKILKNTGLEITKQIGKYACVGIMTDTNALSTNNVDAATYKTVAELCELSVDVYGIRSLFFSGNSLEKYKILACAMRNAEFLLNNKVLFMTLTKEDFEHAGLDENDTVGIINQAFNLKNAYACFLVTPREGVRRVSMRSVEGIDVSKIAESFGGGGHACAAASNTDLSIEEIKENILTHIEKQLNIVKINKDIF